MKKEGVILVIILFSILLAANAGILTPVLAVNNSSSNNISASDSQLVNKAYNCLKGKVAAASNCDSLSAEEQAFALLALAYDSTSQQNCKTALESKGRDNMCWPSTGCKLKDTALAMLARNYIELDVSAARDWLLAQNSTPTNLEWYLQIDTTERASCDISIDGASAHTVIIDDNKKINTDAGSCLSRAQNNYWLKVSPSCYDKKFTISCDKQFFTSLLYKKQNSQTIFVSSQTNNAPADGTTEETVNVKCLAQGNVCDYEGSLWAALALSKAGVSIDFLIPYLSAASVDNEKYLPNAFLFMLTAEDLYWSGLVSQITPQKYWQAASTPYTKYYDSALAIMALEITDSVEAEDAKSYFLSNEASDGCWPGIRDTSILLFSGWPKQPANVDYSVNPCQPTYYCISSGDCALAGGTTLSRNCPSSSLATVCCTAPAQTLSCINKGGVTCQSNENCVGNAVSASDVNNCCVGTCEVQQEYTCNSCKTACGSSEKELDAGSCPLSQVCCGSKSKSYWWIWLLVILIILIVLAILFREKLKLYWMMLVSKFKKTPPAAAPQQPAGMMRRPMFPQRQMPAGMPPIQPSKPIGKSADFESTLKKLKEMSQ